MNHLKCFVLLALSTVQIHGAIKDPLTISYSKNKIEGIEDMDNVTLAKRTEEIKSAFMLLATNGTISSELSRKLPVEIINKIIEAQDLMEGRQLPPLPDDPVKEVTSRVPCECTSGICGCCTRRIFALFNTKGCAKLKYIPEDFAFDFRLTLNDLTLYNNKVSGKNPAPICINLPRLQIIQVCAEFHDLYFVGRNLHVCLDLSGNFEGYEVFNRQFDCLKFGSDGLEFGGNEGHPGVPSSGVDAEVDAGGDLDEEYDEILS